MVNTTNKISSTCQCNSLSLVLWPVANEKLLCGSNCVTITNSSSVQVIENIVGTLSSLVQWDTGNVVAADSSRYHWRLSCITAVII